MVNFSISCRKECNVPCYYKRDSALRIICNKKIRFINNTIVKSMIKEYISKLIDNIPLVKNKKREKMDLIMDGGMFNGSYLIGCLYFLRELENRKYIKICNISGCSISSITGLLYLLNMLTLASEVYNEAYEIMKKEKDIINIDFILDKIREKSPDNICEIVNKKLYISYYDLKVDKKIVKCKYTNIDDVLETIKRSCYVPILLDKNILYKNRYIDGITPHIFRINNCSRRVLYLDLLGYDKFYDVISIKNEKTNLHRILNGLLDIHLFYLKQKQTIMCSYVNNWSFINNAYYHFVRAIAEKIIYYTIYFYYFIKNKMMTREMLEYFDNSYIFKILINFKLYLRNYFIKTYCF